MDFTTLLDNAVFKPSQIALGDDARRLALMQMLPNLCTAAGELVAASVSHRPQNIRIAIEGWHARLPTDPAAAIDGKPWPTSWRPNYSNARRPRPRPSTATCRGASGAPPVACPPSSWLPSSSAASSWLSYCWWAPSPGCGGCLDVTRVPAERGRDREAGVVRRRSAQRRLQVCAEPAHRVLRRMERACRAAARAVRLGPDGQATPSWNQDVVLDRRYRLESPLGRGAQGSVWLGLDLRLNRPVAVKVATLHRHPGQGEHSEELNRRVERFRKEAQAMARISNRPHVAVIHDHGEDGDILYSVMEYIEGRPALRPHRAGPAPHPTDLAPD